MVYGMRAGASDQDFQVSLWKRVIIGKNPKVTLVRAALIALIGVTCWMTFRHVLLPVRLSGISMEPTLCDGSLNLINRLPYLWREPRRGEVVAIRTTGTSIMYLKRIVGLPNETVEIRSGRVLINGQPLVEDYVKDPEPWQMEPRTLQADEYLVVGDNRTMPMELHAAGVIRRNRIVGKAVWQGKPTL